MAIQFFFSVVQNCIYKSHSKILKSEKDKVWSFFEAFVLSQFRFFNKIAILVCQYKSEIFFKNWHNGCMQNIFCMAYFLVSMYHNLGEHKQFNNFCRDGTS